MKVNLADRLQVGSTSLKLPPMGFDAAHLGGMHSRVPGDVARATLRAAWDGGIRHYDAAPFYGLGLSEHRLGDFLIDQPRDEFIVTTEVGRVGFEFPHQSFHLLAASPLPNANLSDFRHIDSASKTRPPARRVALTDTLD